MSLWFHSVERNFPQFARTSPHLDGSQHRVFLDRRFINWVSKVHGWPVWHSIWPRDVFCMHPSLVPPWFASQSFIVRIKGLINKSGNSEQMTGFIASITRFRDIWIDKVSFGGGPWYLSDQVLSFKRVRKPELITLKSIRMHFQDWYANAKRIISKSFYGGKCYLFHGSRIRISMPSLLVFHLRVSELLFISAAGCRL